MSKQLKRFDEFLAKDELASAISYLEQISDSFSTQYAETLRVKKIRDQFATNQTSR